MARKPNPEREALIAELVEKLRRELDTQLPEDNATLDEIEEAAGKIGRALSQDLQHQWVQRRHKQTKSPKIDCGCGGMARYKGCQNRSVVTVHGVLTYKRACYYCACCQKTLAPLDKHLGVDGGATTTQVRLWVALLASKLPFAEAATTLEMLTHVAISAASVERVSVCMGTALRGSEQKVGQAHQQNRLPEPPDKRPRRLYIGMDGVFVPLREAWKKDGSCGELECRFGECKSGVVYETFQDKTGKDRGVRTHAYVATLGKVEAFAPLIGTLAHQQGHHRGKEVVVLGDGAPWIWQIAAKQFSGAVQIVDFYHAAQHLCLLAEARFGKESKEGKAWVEERCSELKTNQIGLVLAQIKAWRPSTTSKKELRQRTYLYFYNNAERMRYQTFLERGYHIGSGVVEASCKHVIAQRLDQAGMHWREESAEAIVALRAAHLCTHPPDLRPYCAMPN
jgi:hypothetical protein